MGEPPKPPDKPHPDECCHRGCEPCILDYYEEAMERWEARVRTLGLDPQETLKSFGRKVD